MEQEMAMQESFILLSLFGIIHRLEVYLQRSAGNCRFHSGQERPEAGLRVYRTAENREHMGAGAEFCLDSDGRSMPKKNLPSYL